MTTLSIVIPTYNTAAMTLRCCKAVLASMPASSEVIVVDDGSIDDTASVLAPLTRPSATLSPRRGERGLAVPSPRLRGEGARRADEGHITIIRLEKNLGFAGAANRGVAEAKGDIILLLNSDTIVDSNALRAFVDAFDRDPRLGVAGAQLINEDGTLQWSGGRTPTLLWMIAVVTGVGARRNRGVAKKKINVDWVSGAAMAFRAEVWKPLNETYRFYCQDIDFCLRARSEGWDIRILDNARVTHLLGATVNAAPEVLWRDLLTWGRAHYGRAWSWLASAILLPLIAIRRTVRGRARA